MFSEQDKQLAKDYYEGGHTPKETETAMYKNHAVRVTTRTIDNWQKARSWRHWSLAKKELIDNANPSLPFGVSKIKDPVFHDCEAIAKNWCRGEGYRNDGPIRPVIQGA